MHEPSDGDRPVGTAALAPVPGLPRPTVSATRGLSPASQEGADAIFADPFPLRLGRRASRLRWCPRCWCSKRFAGHGITRIEQVMTDNAWV
jgi:hypothetical protein